MGFGGIRYCGKYVQVRDIGSGGMGDVYLVNDGRNNKYVAKLPKYGYEYEKRLKNEINFLKDVIRYGGNENIVKYVDNCEDAQGIPILIEEYVSGTLMSDMLRSGKIRKISEQKVRSIMGKLINAVEFIHSMGYIVRDIAPDNIILRNNNIEDPVIIDFGTIRKGETTGRNITGPVHGKPYIAPECNNEAAYFKSDVYSLGMIAFSLFAGEEITQGSISKYSRSSHGLQNYPSKLLNRSISPDIDEGIYWATRNNVADRITLSEFKNAFYTRGKPHGGMLHKQKVTKGAHLLLGHGKKITLKKGSSTLLGRDYFRGLYSISILETISHNHARIYYDGSNWIIEDLCSTNGTLIIRGGRMIIVYRGTRGGTPHNSPCGSASLRNGDIIGLAFKSNNPSDVMIKIRFEGA